MNLYLDASALVALLTDDVHAERAILHVAAPDVVPVVSDWARAEFASVIGRLVRSGEMTRADGHGAFLTLDGWSAAFAEREETRSEDIAAADALLRRLDLTLRAPDAVHLALASRTGATLLTFDGKLAASAKALDLPVLL